MLSSQPRGLYFEVSCVADVLLPALQQSVFYFVVSYVSYVTVVSSVTSIGIRYVFSLS